MSKCQNARWEDVEMSKCQVRRCQNARCWEDVKTRRCVMQCYHQWMTIWRFMTYYLIYSFISYVQLPSVNNYLKIRNLLSDSQFCAVCLCLQRPELHMAEISCLLGRLWRNLSPVEKLPFMKGCTDVHGVSRCLSYVESYLLNFEPWEGTVIECKSLTRVECNDNPFKYATFSSNLNLIELDCLVTKLNMNYVSNHVWEEGYATIDIF